MKSQCRPSSRKMSSLEKVRLGARCREAAGLESRACWRRGMKLRGWIQAPSVRPRASKRKKMFFWEEKCGSR
jgi:hypothetical protein